MKALLSFFLMGLLLSTAQANTWIRGTQVSRLREYFNSSTHHVWLTGGTGSECNSDTSSDPILQFNVTASLGRPLLATIVMAQAKGATVDVQTEGCQIVEFHVMK